MKKALVLGKFMPIHNGHIKLIHYAAQQCDEVLVWVCVSNKESMSGKLRFNWVCNVFKDQTAIKPILFLYDEKKLPNTSQSSREISKTWAKEIQQKLPPIDFIVSCEEYGDYLAEYLGIKHLKYPSDKIISATEIRNNPYKNWQEIPDIVKPHFLKKVAIVGTESTGKSMLTKKLATHYNTEMVSETGRDIVDNSNQCSENDLKNIAIQHSKNIIEKEKQASGILFIDTEIHITKSYAKFLFHKELDIISWVMKANACNLYLFLENDAPYIQDGTRLSKEKRDALNRYHKAEFKKAGIKYVSIKGNWQERFEQAVEHIQVQLGIKTN